MTTAFTVVIPSRYASTRLPGKPLLLIAGKPMIQHVWEQASKSSAGRVVVATDDARIVEACNGFGAEVVLTREDHNSGTDRLAEVAMKLGLAPDAIVVNVQGDEPLLPSALVRQVAALLAATPDAAIATIAAPITQESEYLDPNVVKVVARPDGMALYFSRAPVPWDRDGSAEGRASNERHRGSRRHLGLYAYRVAALHALAAAPPASLEQRERLEQLRALAIGLPIVVADAAEPPGPGVDTPEDLARAESIMRKGAAT